MVRQESALVPTGENPVYVKVSLRRRTMFYVWGGDESSRAKTKDVSGRNVSECIEPRNIQHRRGWRFHMCGKQHEGQRNGKLVTRSIGVWGNGMIQDGSSVNLGYLLRSYKTLCEYAEASHKRRGQQTMQQKSDWLIVLRVWESHAQGEAIRVETINWGVCPLIRRD